MDTSRRQTSWGTIVDLVQGTYPGDASSPQIAVTDQGDALVVWLQYDDGVQGVWARAYQAGVLGSPTVVSPTAQSLDVATNGTAFVVVWSDGAYRNLVSARRYLLATSSWDAPVALKTSAGSVWPPAITSDGSGFLLAYPSTSSVVYNTSSDGLTWSGDLTFSGSYSDLRLVANGSNILALGPSSTYPLSLYARIYSSGAWGSSQWLGSASDSGSIDAAPHGSGFILVWYDGSSTVNAASWDGAWSTTALTSSYGSSAPPSVASDGTTAVALYRDGYTDMVTRTFAAGTWSAPTTLPQSASGPLAATQAGFAGIHVRSDGAEPGLSSNSMANGIWDYAGGFIDGLSGAVSSPVLKSTSTSYYLVWARQSAEDNAGQIWMSMEN